MKKKYDLRRFLLAQEGIYEEVVAELEKGKKTGHYMWFIFPQEKGLGKSWISEYFGLDGVEEARAYWKCRVLRERLIECISTVEAWLVLDKTLEDIFGPVDALKYKSCVELFSKVGLKM